MGEMEEEVGCAASLPRLATGNSPSSYPVQTSWLYGQRTPSPEKGRTLPTVPSGLEAIRRGAALRFLLGSASPGLGVPQTRMCVPAPPHETTARAQWASVSLLRIPGHCL